MSKIGFCNSYNFSSIPFDKLEFYRIMHKQSKMIVRNYWAQKYIRTGTVTEASWGG